MDRSLIRQKLLFFVLDGFLILLAFVVAYYFRLGTFARGDFSFAVYLENALFTLPIWLLFLIWGEKYSLEERSVLQNLRAVTLASIAGAMLFVLVFFFRREIFFSRLIVFYIFFSGMLFGMGSYFFEKFYERFKRFREKGIVRVLVIGANAAAAEAIAALRFAGSRFVPVAVLAPYGGSAKAISGVPVFGKLDALERITEQEKIQEILLCDGNEQILNLLSFAEGRFLGFRIAPEILGVFRNNIAPEILAGKTFLTLRPSPLLGWGQLWKRTIDLLSSLLLILIFLPIWILQKLLRGGKELFTAEKRIGAAGKEFALIRYAGVRRHFLRDIPNILNIWRGEMSLVGPRPVLPEEWENLPAHFKRRLILKPGLLGEWQIRKLRGEKDNFEEMCERDIHYLQTWSFRKDLGILVQSVWEMIRRIIGNKKS